MIYRKTHILGDGIIGVVSIEFGKQMWVRGIKNGYKEHICVLCGRIVKKNTEVMYRPFGNPGNRMRRMCINCGDDMRK